MAIVKFGEVASRLNIHVDQANTDLEYYIGGEHIESREFMIHSKAPIKGATIGYQFQFGFEPGDILFMTKNPHLRKASMVDFRGLCSIATFVIRTNDPKLLLQEYLLIEMQSDRFWNYLEEHKSGGVNYFINWGTLSNYEFDLPPLHEQKILADKLWAAYRLKESYKKLLAATDEMVKSQFIEMFGNPVTNPKGWKTSKIKDVAPESPSKESVDGRVWLLNLDMIESNTGKVIEKVYEDSENALSVQPFDEGNVLFSKLRPYLNKVVIPDEPGLATTELVPLRPKGDILNKIFFSHLLRGDQFVNFANDIAGGTKMPRMPLSELRKFECILPPIEEQMKFVAIAELADKSKFVGLKSQFIEMFGECQRKEKLSSLCETFIDGDWIESKDQSEDGIRLVQTGNVGYGYFKDKEDKSRYISEETFNRLHCTEIFAGDILVSRLPDPIGRACIIPEGIGRMITAVDCSIIRLKDVILPEYFISYTMTSTYSAQINEVTTGTTRRRVSRANLGNVLVPCPSLEAQRQFVAISQQADKSKYYYQIA